MGTREVVVNRCYGGFGLSRAGVLRYGEIKGTPLYAFRDKISMKFGSDASSDLFTHYATVPVEDGGDAPNDTYWSDHGIPRDDPALVQTVRELGDKAHGRCAELAIVEIPDDVEWVIEEYDGREWVAEKHRTW